MATERQKAYIKRLCAELGYDSDDYNLDGMSKDGACELIKDLKDELGW